MKLFATIDIWIYTKTRHKNINIMLRSYDMSMVPVVAASQPLTTFKFLGGILLRVVGGFALSPALSIHKTVLDTTIILHIIVCRIHSFKWLRICHVQLWQSEYIPFIGGKLDWEVEGSFLTFGITTKSALFVEPDTISLGDRQPTGATDLTFIDASRVPMRLLCVAVLKEGVIKLVSPFIRHSVS